MDLEERLTKANRYIKSLETQLNFPNDNHPRWTDSGEIVLVGDRGTFGGETGIIIGMNARTGLVTVEIDGEAVTYKFNDCRTLGSRGRLPRM